MKYKGVPGAKNVGTWPSGGLWRGIRLEMVVRIL